MKIVLVNTRYGIGSTGRICVDLYDTLKKRGDTPYIASRTTLPADIDGYKISNQADFLFHVMKNFVQGKAGFGSRRETEKFIAWLEEIKPDVIHLHNIHGFYLQTELLFSYLKEAGIPVVWTLHDCWPFTGHCAYFDYISCEKWKNEGCHDCSIHVTAYPYAIFKDNTRWNFAAKKQAYTGVPNLTIVTPSHWLAGLVKQSFLQDYPVAVIPNGINLEQFAPSETPDGSAQEQPASAAMSGGKGTEQPAPGKKLVLGVANQWEERKGLPFFLWLVENLPENYVVELVGLNKRQYRRLKKQFPNERLIPITHTKNVQELAALYRAADVYVNATLEDNFPTTNLEALACGTPVITFATGGSVESVTDTCGVIVPKGDKRRLLEAVRNVAEKQPFRAEDCRAQALNYDRKDRYTEYVALYDRVRND